MTYRRTVMVTLASVLAVALYGILIAQAQAAPKILEFSITPSSTQAGGHPDFRTFVYTENADTTSEPGCCGDPKTIVFNAPAGAIGLPQALPQCNQDDFAQEVCPIDTQVGRVLIGINNSVPGESSGTGTATASLPIYNLVAHPGQAGLLGLQVPVLESPIFIIVDSRTESDYGLTFTTAQLPHTFGTGVSHMTVDFWGVPAATEKDPLRLGPPGCDIEGILEAPCAGGFKSNSPLTPFINSPTTCGVPLETSVEILYYDRSRDRMESPYPGTTGCDLLSFNPSLFGQPTTTSTDAPSGLEVDLKVPQGTSPEVPAPSEIRGTEMALPEGFSINSNAADGKTACSDDAANFGVRKLAAECPEFSKVGTLEISSTSLPGPLPGFVYLGEPKPGDRYRLLLIADGFGLHVKLPGSVVPNPQTGKLTTVFKNLPQFPFEEFNIHLFGAERGVLATPTRCGTYAVDTTFTPWNAASPDQTSTQFFELDSGPGGQACPGGTRPFNPGFRAGVADKTGGAHSPFTVELTREDGEQDMAGIDVTTPPGFLASIKGIPYCPEAAIAQVSDARYSGLAEQATPACPANSQVGTAAAAAGAGSRPVHVAGKVYLAGPYKGAPLSLLVVVPAVSGPYDLGNIAVRVATKVDRTTAQISTISDPLPQIIEGIPLRVRSIRVALDRPGFALNPTNCDPLAVAATVIGDEGGSINPISRFQVANCADLPYGPQLRLRLTGGVKRRGHPAIHALFRARKGEANTRRVSVTLPKGHQLDNAHLETICTRVQFAEARCPEGSRIGTAKVSTPLLDEPLNGSVYLRSSSNKLPDMAIDLKGQIDFELVGKVDSQNERLRTTFESVPDVPVSSFELDLLGGRRGLLINSKSLCGVKKRASVRMVGQNVRTLSRQVRLQTSCGSTAKRKRHGTKRLHAAVRAVR